MTEDDDVVAEHLVRRMAGSDRDAPCPDPNLLVGFAEGHLSVAETERVAVHAAVCPDCREAIVVVRGTDAEGLPSASDAAAIAEPGRHARRWPAFAAAALLLVAIGTTLYLRNHEPEPTVTSTDVRLAASARELASARPDLFGGFTPVGAVEAIVAEPDGPREPRERGGLALTSPVGIVLSGRPTFRWGAVPGAKDYEVHLARPGGETIWMRTVTQTALAYPPDAPELEAGSRWTWTVDVEAVLGGRTKGRRAFSVATAEERAAFADAARVVSERSPADLQDLLLAHLALRRGFLDEAESRARAYVSRTPNDGLGRETLHRVLLLRGSPEASGYAATNGSTPAKTHPTEERRDR